MSTFVLVHGAWHGAWCWYRTVALLEAAGHRVIAPDLPGHGIDRTPVADVTLAACTDRVCTCIDAAGEPVVLVGHSMGGAIIAGVSEQRPDAIRVAVYLAAFLLEDGVSVFAQAEQDTTSLVLPNLEFSADGTSVTVRPDRVREIFYADCSDEDVALARSLLVPQALAPPGTPIRTSDGDFGRVPRAYIECLADRAIPIALQRQMHGSHACRMVVSMDTSHSPFFSAPRELTRHLCDIDARDWST